MPHDPLTHIHHEDARTALRGEPTVTFVGAGPGPADLLTVRAVRALASADVVVHDLLVQASLLAEATATARLVSVSEIPSPEGGAPESESDPGERIGRFLIGLAVEGRRVVRLKGGDPTVFARLAEEMRPLLRAGVRVEVVPGVTAALAAAAAAAIPLTSRTKASSLTLVTGHNAGDGGATLDLGPFATLPGSLAFYMGVERVEEWSAKLIASGRPPGTPVAIVSRCGWPDERILRTTLGELALAIDREAVSSPAVAIVGEVVNEGGGSRPRGGSKASRSLEGRRILLVRPEGQSASLAAILAARGGTTMELPAVRIEPPCSWQPLDDALRTAASYDWIVFTSANGVRAFVARLRHHGLDARSLGTTRLAAVGPGTAEALAEGDLACDFVPSEAFRAESLADALAGCPPPARFLIVRGDRGRDVLARRLSEAGHHVVEVVGYRTVDVTSLDHRRLADLRQWRPDWIILTSPAIAASALRLFSEFLPEMRIATISPLTSDAVRQLGASVAAEASRATPEAIVEAIAAAQTACPP